MYDKPVKLFSTRYTPSLKDYDFPHEYYVPRDYYGQASQIAKKFCKKHPDADKDTVYMAASEAAYVYDLGGPNTRAKFQTVVEVKIRAALLELKKRRKPQNEPQEKEKNELITPEIKAAIINDARAGLTAKTIAAKCGMNEKTVEYHLCEARTRGELPPAKGSTKKHKKPEPVIEEPRTVIANGERVTLPPDDPEPIPDKHPEAYPGQINDEDTKTADSPQVDTLKEASKPRVTIGGKCLTGYKLQDVTAHACDIPADWHVPGGLWQLLSVELAEHVRDILGEGSICVERSYNEDSGKLKAVIKNADGRKYKLKLEEIK